MELLDVGRLGLGERVNDLQLRSVLESELGLAWGERIDDAIEHLRPHCGGNKKVEPHNGAMKHVVSVRSRDVASASTSHQDTEAVFGIVLFGHPSACNHPLGEVGKHLLQKELKISKMSISSMISRKVATHCAVTKVIIVGDAQWGDASRLVRLLGDLGNDRHGGRRLIARHAGGKTLHRGGRRMAEHCASCGSVRCRSSQDSSLNE